MPLENFLNTTLKAEAVFEGPQVLYPDQGVEFKLDLVPDGRYRLTPLYPSTDLGRFPGCWAYSHYHLLEPGDEVDPEHHPDAPGITIDRNVQRLFGITSFADRFYYVWFFTHQVDDCNGPVEKLCCVARTLGTGLGKYSNIYNGGYNNGRD